ncbi:amidase-like isoform X1 [Watersipora subatra]|uniref:amidase-like isoform X1 n=1 Tax=Watersipora subatra TaxID=2589382 RepID=UPI00355C66F4
MANSRKAYTPLVEPATEEDVETICEDLGLGINEKELEEYREWLNEALSGCDQIQNIEEETIPVLYPRVPGVKPPAKDNIYNAWASSVLIKGERDGLLSGKKIAIKDNIFVAGTPLKNGSKVWDGYTPEFDATVVTRILQARGTIIGKSTCENQCFSGSSFTSHGGPVRNPHDTERSAGGSSSGSAVLVATGEVEMALGGDQGGSVRLPSSCTGCVGLKPTWGLVPVTGSLGMMPAADHIGPMAATVADVALLLEVIAGYDDGRDHRQRPDILKTHYSELLKGDLSGKKFASVKEGFYNATEEVKTEIQSVVDKMRAAAATVDEISIPLHSDGSAVFGALRASMYDNMIRSHGQASGYNEFYQVSAMKHSFKSRARDMQPTVKAAMLFGEYLQRNDGSQVVARAMNMRPTIRKAYDDVLQAYDALIMPTIPFVAHKLPKPGLSVTEFIKEAKAYNQNTQMFNLTGHPSLSLNVGMAMPNDGGAKMPVGLMITGKHYQDDKVLDLAFGIEQMLKQ